MLQIFEKTCGRAASCRAAIGPAKVLYLFVISPKHLNCPSYCFVNSSYDKMIHIVWPVVKNYMNYVRHIKS